MVVGEVGVGRAEFAEGGSCLVKEGVLVGKLPCSVIEFVDVETEGVGEAVLEVVSGDERGREGGFF